MSEMFTTLQPYIIALIALAAVALFKSAFVK